MTSRPDLHPRVLRCFVTLAEVGTYTHAAALLHISVPALSQQMRKLEADLEVPLIERDHRGARLTPAGHELLTAARELLTLHDRTITQVRHQAQNAPERIRIGFYGSVAGPRTHSILDTLRRIAPHTRIELVQLPWGEQITAVLDGRVDASFARPPFAESRIRTYPVLTEPRVVIMSSQHPLAAHTTLSLSDLDGVVQIDTVDVPDEWRRWWSINPRPNGTPVTYGPVVHSAEEMLEVIATSDAVGLTPESIAEVSPRRDIAYRVITDVEPARIVLVLPDVPHPTAAPLVQALREAT